MIEIIRTEDCTECDSVQAALDEMVISYKVTTVHGSFEDVPMLREGDRVIARAEIEDYLAELSGVVADWNRFQSDACYVDAHSGAVC